MIFKILCILVLWTKVASALDGLRQLAKSLDDNNSNDNGSDVGKMFVFFCPVYFKVCEYVMLHYILLLTYLLS